MIVPITTGAERIFGGTSRNSVSSIAVQARSSADLTGAYQEADHLLLELHGITNATDADFTITSEQSLIAANTSVDHTLTILLGGIAAISLIVGGIGVMNIMLVSVTERIREIGLRKALGATPRVIRRQFLVEASVLGVIGGILGVAAGILGVIYLPGLIGDPISTSPTAAVGALAIALAIGVALRRLPGQPGRHPGAHRRPAQRVAIQMSHDPHDTNTNSNERGSIDMQTPTSRRTNGGRWARCLGIGTMARRDRRGHRRAGVRRGAGQRTGRCHGERRRAQRLEHGGAKPIERPDHGHLDRDDAFSKTVTESVSSVAVGDCVTATGTASKKSKTTIVARSIDGDHAELDRHLHRRSPVRERGQRHATEWLRRPRRWRRVRLRRGWRGRHPAVVPLWLRSQQLPQEPGESSTSPRAR